MILQPNLSRGERASRTPFEAMPGRPPCEPSRRAPAHPGLNRPKPAGHVLPLPQGQGRGAGHAWPPSISPPIHRLLLLLLTFLPLLASAAQPLASLEYRVVGAQLRAFPESVTVPRTSKRHATFCG